MFSKTLITSTIATLATVVLVACGGSGGDNPPAVNNPPAAGDTVVLTASGNLVSFNRASPGTTVSSIAVSGLAAGDTLLGIDFRPADSLLYVLATGGKIYTVDPSTGVATLRTTLVADATDITAPFTVLMGTAFGVDFNPAADRLRVISDTGQSLRINVDTGATITDGNIAPAGGGAASITAAGYTNAFAGTVSTRLFDIDAGAGVLYVQDPPNAGTLDAGVALGVAGATTINGFDIDARNNVGYAALTVGGTTMLYSVNLSAAAAAATNLGPVAGGVAVLGLALRQPAAAAVIGLTADARLVTFDPRTPNILSANVPISGLLPGEAVLGIDFRPSDGRLYALANTGRLYTVDPVSGAATLKATLVADATDATAPFTVLMGTTFGVDFNPAADRLRVISDTGQNLRINVDTGATTTDATINRAGGAAMVVAAAYTNSFPGATTTTLFDLEATTDVLAQQVPPNNGTLVDVGPVGFDIAAGNVAFDIAGGGNAAYAALRAGGIGPFSLYSVSLATGAATLSGNTGGNAALSQIGGVAGPALIDIAVRL